MKKFISNAKTNSLPLKTSKPYIEKQEKASLDEEAQEGHQQPKRHPKDLPGLRNLTNSKIIC
jgi:hypothetical protein